MAVEQADSVLWPGRPDGIVFGCGAGSMLRRFELPLDSVRIERFGSRNQNPGQIIFPEAPGLQGPLVSCKQKKNSFLAYKILINPQFLIVKVEALSCCCL